ncbi:hypothetical protein TorRG33x02_277670 [Trema orientale]|uniref:Uncharacterized protein n=1 Tax=Trema orientale TaxID=63057 RepID=A0A2P5CPI8_TREOI|nr:hypothetical protein TorRG33x02_277670 [Trema orientale]
MSTPASGPPPVYPLHRITALMRHLQRCLWLNDLRRNHPDPRYRHSIASLQGHIDLIPRYIQRHRLLPSVIRSRPPHHQQEEQLLHHHQQYNEAFRIHRRHLRELFTTLHEYLRPVGRCVFIEEHLARYQGCVEILYSYTNLL